MKNNTQNMVGKLVEDTFYKKKQNWEYIWINSLKCVLIVCSKEGWSSTDHLLWSYIKLSQKKRSRTSLPA